MAFWTPIIIASVALLAVDGKQRCKLNENLPAVVEFGIYIPPNVHSITDRKGGIRFDTSKDYIGLPEFEFRRLSDAVSDHGRNPQNGGFRLNVTYDGVFYAFTEQDVQYAGIQVMVIHGEQWVLGNPMIRKMCE